MNVHPGLEPEENSGQPSNSQTCIAAELNTGVSTSGAARPGDFPSTATAPASDLLLRSHAAALDRVYAILDPDPRRPNANHGLIASGLGCPASGGREFRPLGNPRVPRAVRAGRFYSFLPTGSETCRVAAHRPAATVDVRKS